MLIDEMKVYLSTHFLEYVLLVASTFALAVVSTVQAEVRTSYLLTYDITLNIKSCFEIELKQNTFDVFAMKLKT